MPGVLLWAWDGTNDVWIPLQVDANGCIKVDMANIKLNDLGDVNAPTPADTEALVWDAATSKWIPGAAGAGTFLGLTDTPGAYAGQAGKSAVVNAATNALAFAKRASVSTANKTIYVDKDATGAADGTSWTDAFTTIQAAVDSLEDIVAHAYTITVRKGSIPYREQVELTKKLITGTLTIAAEFYWQASCDANAVVGDIVDTSADFSNVAVGDHVMVLDRNGADGRVQDYEFCTVDDITNIGTGRIGTDGAKTATTGWSYLIVRTEISGSDDGTDGGTARNYCWNLKTIDNITIYGFYMTFSDSGYLYLFNSRQIVFSYFIAKDCDDGMRIYNKSVLTAWWFGQDGASYYTLYARSQSYADIRYFAATGVSYLIAAYASSSCYLNVRDFYIDTASYAIYMRYLSVGQVGSGTISANATRGVYARENSCCRTFSLTNNAGTPVDPVGTTEGAYIY